MLAVVCPNHPIHVIGSANKVVAGVGATVTRKVPGIAQANAGGCLPATGTVGIAHHYFVRCLVTVHHAYAANHMQFGSRRRGANTYIAGFHYRYRIGPIGGRRTNTDGKYPVVAIVIPYSETAVEGAIRANNYLAIRGRSVANTLGEGILPTGSVITTGSK